MPDETIIALGQHPDGLWEEVARGDEHYVNDVLWDLVTDPEVHFVRNAYLSLSYYLRHQDDYPLCQPDTL